MSDGQHDTPYPSEGDQPLGGKKPVETIIRRGIFYNPETEFFVISVRLDGMPDEIRLIGKRTCITGADNIQQASDWPENAELKVEDGSWKTHKNHGWQFEVTSGTLSMPTSKDGMES